MLALGFHKRVAILRRGGDVGVPHQLLLHPDGRPGVVQPRPVGVAERVQAHIAQFAFRGKLLPLVMNGDRLALSIRTALADGGAARRTRERELGVVRDPLPFETRPGKLSRMRLELSVKKEQI